MKLHIQKTYSNISTSLKSHRYHTTMQVLEGILLTAKGSI